MSFLSEHEAAVRLVAFFGVFLLVALAERLWPRRVSQPNQAVRWVNNLGLTFANTALARVLLPIVPVAFAAWVQARGWGLLGLVDLPAIVEVAVAVVLLDLAIYAQHVAFHAVPALWRLHRMHHADTAYDVTTGSRFHPLEIGLSLGIKFVVIGILGAPPVAVVLFEVVLNACAMFNHGNVRLPLGVDRVVRQLIVTPDMHRVHHSRRADEMHANFGFNLAVWDRLFGTYVDQPADGHEAMEIGLPCFREPAELRVDRLLTQPFRGDCEVDAGVGGAPA